MKRIREYVTTHRVDLITLVGAVVLAIGVNLPAYLAVNSDKAQLNILSLDEWAYMDFLGWGLYGPLQSWSITDLAVLQDSWGYGSIFWYIYGLIGLPAHYFGSFTAEIMTYRILSAAWLGASMWLIYKIVLYFKQPIYRAWIAAATLLTLPGFYFYEKAFSAEFFQLCASLTTLYLFLLFLAHGKKTHLYWAAGLFGLTVGIKISVIVFAPVLLISYLWQERNKTVFQASRTLVVAGMAASSGFFIANPYVLLLRRAGVNHYLSLLIQNLNSNATNHGLSITDIGLGAWYQNVITQYFFPTWYIILALFILLVVAFQQRYRLIALATLVATSVGYLLYIMFTVKKLWLWYLFPGIVVVPIILGIVNWKRTWLNYVLPIGVFFLVLSVSWDGILQRVQEMRGREYQATFQIKQQAKEQFDDWLAIQPYSGTFLKSPYIYFDETIFSDRSISVASIWGSLSVSYITTYQPTLLLIEKNYGFLRPDDEINTWTSYPELLVEREFFQTLTNTDYRLVFETDSFYVYARN